MIASLSFFLTNSLEGQLDDCMTLVKEPQAAAIGQSTAKPLSREVEGKV